MPKSNAIWRSAGLPVLSGVLYFLSWVGFGFWPLAFVCLIPLLLSLVGASSGQALRRGWLMGFVTHLGGYPWLIHMLALFGGFPLPVSLLGYALVCGFQGLLFGVFAWLINLAWARTRWPLVFLVPIALCAVEWIYPLLFQSYTGVALMPLKPVVQIAELGGVLLVTALVALVNGALADSLMASFRGGNAIPSMTVSIAALCATVAFGVVRIPQVQRLEARAQKRAMGIAQPNVGEVELHKDPAASVNALWDETAELSVRGADLAIWPEGGFNDNLIDERAPGLGRLIQHEVPISIVAGVIRTDPTRTKLWNSALLVHRDGRVEGHYDKIVRVPFGEYIPLGDVFPILYSWSPMASSLSEGTSRAPLVDGRVRMSTFICYEDILPGLVRSLMKKDDFGQRPNVLVNLTNDSWYGGFHEQEQHLQLAAMRSIEHRRWLARATSNGISAFVDAIGNVVSRIPAGERRVAVAEVPLLEVTTLYEVLGEWPGYLSALLLLAALTRGRLWARRANAASER